MSLVTCVCEICKKEFQAKKADRARGWAKCCSKRCAAIKRERKTGNYQRFCEARNVAIRSDYAPGFDNAHQFSNEEHDCNKE